MKRIAIVLMVLFFLPGLYAQNAKESVTYKGSKYYPIPMEYLPNEESKYMFNSDIEKYKKNAVFVDTLIGKWDKNADLTTFLQNVLDKYPVVVFPNSAIKINDKGLRLKSNQVLIFQEKSQIELVPNNKTHFAALIIDEVQGVKVYNANIRGERFEHLDNKGQWGMGIQIRGSKDIKIINPTVREMWGDGIYIGGKNQVPSADIEVYFALLDNNRRNAISITSANGVKLVKPLVANSNGQAPQAGIDIEPNNNDDIVNNIVIDRPISYYNHIYGIAISLTRLPGIIPKEVNVEINDPLIIGGKYGVAVLGIYENPHRYVIKGKIDVKNLTTYYNALTIREFRKLQFDLDINISNMRIYHKNKKGSLYFNQKQLDRFLDNLKVLHKK